MSEVDKSLLLEAARNFVRELSSTEEVNQERLTDFGIADEIVEITCEIWQRAQKACAADSPMAGDLIKNFEGEKEQGQVTASEYFYREFITRVRDAIRPILKIDVENMFHILALSAQAAEQAEQAEKAEKAEQDFSDDKIDQFLREHDITGNLPDEEEYRKLQKFNRALAKFGYAVGSHLKSDFFTNLIAGKKIEYELLVQFFSEKAK